MKKFNRLSALGQDNPIKKLLAILFMVYAYIM